MFTLGILGSTFIIATVVLLLLIPRAAAIHLVDHPGGRKEHARVTPLIGGAGIAVTLFAALFWLQPAYLTGLAFALAIIVTVGIADDIHEIPPLPKFLAQAAACLVMVFIANVKLHSVGNLIGTGPIGMWVFVIPMSVFAVIGVINAINMSDGIDGHAGSIGLVAFVAYAFVARESGLWDQYKILLAAAGAVAAFLLLNARWPWNAHARTFLGDSGSMLLGFLIGWFAIDLSAGNGAPNNGTRSFAPICALWVIMMPLCDCVSLMIRRKLAGTSMFVADRQHWHHYLLNRGLRPGQANAVSALVNAICAVIGIMGWKLGVPEPAMFAGFVALFIGYHLHMRHAFRTMPTHSQMH